MKKMIFEQDVRSLACGARYLGSGGGGDSNVLQLLTTRAIRECGPVPFASVFTMNESDWAVPVGIMGSPTILNEKILTGSELTNVIAALEAEKGIQARALLGFEIGGINALTPVLAAALSNLPLLDSDGMGRAFSELQMTTFHAYGITAAPVMMTTEQGGCERILSESNWEVESLARTKVMEMGGWAAISCYPMQIHEVRECAIHQTFSLAIRLGEAVRAASGDISQVVAALEHVFASSIYGPPAKLIEGKVVELQRSNCNGLLHGTLTVEGTGYYISEQLDIMFQNEYLLASLGSRELAMVPDLICVLDADTGNPILSEELENHQKVWVVAIPAPPLVRDCKMLEIVGPESYGLAHPFIPLEYLQSRTEEDRPYVFPRD